MLVITPLWLSMATYTGLEIIGIHKRHKLDITHLHLHLDFKFARMVGLSEGLIVGGVVIPDISGKQIP
jgi:hypothetical protein